MPVLPLVPSMMVPPAFSASSIIFRGHAVARSGCVEESLHLGGNSPGMAMVCSKSFTSGVCPMVEDVLVDLDALMPRKCKRYPGQGVELPPDRVPARCATTEGSAATQTRCARVPAPIPDAAPRIQRIGEGQPGGPLEQALERPTQIAACPEDVGGTSMPEDPIGQAPLDAPGAFNTRSWWVRSRWYSAGPRSC